MRVLANTTVLLGAVLALAVAAPPASALDILIADDYFGGIDGDLGFLETPLTLAGHNVAHADNTDGANNPLLTDFAEFMADFDVVIFYGSGNDNMGREITAGEQDALEAYVQGGGNLIATGYDILGSPDDPRLADLVRSSTYGDKSGLNAWTAANVDHFILNGPFGDYRGESITLVETDHDQLTADVARSAVSLGSLDSSSFDKIIFTDLPAPGGSVGV